MSYINSRMVRSWTGGMAVRYMTPVSNKLVSRMTAGQLAQCSRARLASGPQDRLFSGVSIDSRTVHEGELFVAIRGPRNDGHDYVAAAIAAGAGGAVVDERFAAPKAFPQDRVLIRAEDTHQALKEMARAVRQEWRGSVVGITGSMGKTTTKEFCAQILETEFTVYRTPGNLNNLFGLPLALLGMATDDHIGIFEMGMSAPGEIAEMCRIASPVIGILTNVAPVHLAFFPSIGDIARAKSELVQTLPPDGSLIFNCDDPLVRIIAADYPGDRIGFGTGPRADVRAEDIELTGLGETRFRLDCAGVVRKALIPLGGHHYVMNALAAVALASRYRVPLDQIVDSLVHLRPASMRGGVLRFRAGFTVIDDSYNSNPQALTGMIDTLTGVVGYRRRILIAGEMLELGPASDSLHYECGRHAAFRAVDVVIAIQGSAREIARGARDAGLSDSQARFFPELGAAVDFVDGLLEPGDLVLVKGSRGVHLEKIIEALRACRPLEEE